MLRVFRQMNLNLSTNVMRGGVAALLAVACVPAMHMGPSFAQSAPIAAALAAGPLVSPTRLVMEGRERSGSFIVVNTSTVMLTYRVRVVNQRMLENGSFEPFNVPRSDELVASDMLLFSPRQFSLEPNEVQVIRVLARKPPNLAPGEYRSHMVFSSLPPAQTGQTLQTNRRQDGIAIQLIPIKGVAVPVIVRHGSLSSGLTLAEASFTPGEGNKATVSIRMNRTGTQSVFGDLEVTFVDGAGQTQIAGATRGVAVYTPNGTRTVNIAVTMPDGISSGQFRVVYKERPNAGGAEISAVNVTF